MLNIFNHPSKRIPFNTGPPPEYGHYNSLVATFPPTRTNKTTWHIVLSHPSSLHAPIHVPALTTTTHQHRHKDTPSPRRPRAVLQKSRNSPNTPAHQHVLLQVYDIDRVRCRVAPGPDCQDRRLHMSLRERVRGLRESRLRGAHNREVEVGRLPLMRR